MTAEVPSLAQVTRELEWNYFKTRSGQLRSAEAVLSLSALISTSTGHCAADHAKFGFILFVVIICFIQATIGIITFVARLDKKIKTAISQVTISLAVLLNDGILMLFLFISSLLSLFSIGSCGYFIAARIFAALFVLSLFLTMVGLCYVDYLSWQDSTSSKENNGEVDSAKTNSPPNS